MQDCKWLESKKNMVNFQKQRVFIFSIPIFVTPCLCLMYKNNLTKLFILGTVIITIFAILAELKNCNNLRIIHKDTFRR